MSLPVRVWGTDLRGRPFLDAVFTHDVSKGGVVVHCRQQLQPGELVGLTYQGRKSRFRVVWVGSDGTPVQGFVGLANLRPESAFWGVKLPQGQDTYERRHPRVECDLGIELYLNESPVPLRAKVSEVSVGSCYVRVFAPCEPGTRLRMALWILDTRIWLEGVVIRTEPGSGMAVGFTRASQEELGRLEKFVAYCMKHARAGASR